MFRSVLAFALAVATLLVTPAPVLAASPQAWIVLSDLHFDPFTQPHLVDRLAAAPPERWRAIFATGDVTAPSGRGSELSGTYVSLCGDAS
jgi:sphingomyelin phosphodiesterase acid-like 3